MLYLDLIVRSIGQYSVLTAFVNPGDEVIMFEPFFDQYLATIVFNGGIPIYVPLHPDPTKSKPTSDDWKLDFEELRYVSFYPIITHIDVEFSPAERLLLAQKSSC